MTAKKDDFVEQLREEARHLNMARLTTRAAMFNRAADEIDRMKNSLRECELFVRVLGLDSEPARKAAENARAALGI